MQSVTESLRDGAAPAWTRLRFGGWDTHVHQGTPEGRFRENGARFSRALAKMWDDIAEIRSGVTVVTTTEFGRSVRENASRGTDHGGASVAFVLGETVAGGRIYGAFPKFNGPASTLRDDLPAVLGYGRLWANVGGVRRGDDASLHVLDELVT